MIETIGKIILIIACLFMAGLNLWLEFKGWFSKRYQRKDKTGDKKQEPRLQNDRTPDIVGKSKFNLHEVQVQADREKREQEQEQKQKQEPAPTLAEQPNPVIHSEHLEQESLPDNKSAESEEDISLPVAIQDRIDVELQGSQSITMDEFELLAKTLEGKPISQNEEKHVPEILQKVQGTNLYEQFIGQVNGAEKIASNILALAETDSEANNSNSSNPGNLSKFIRT
ncbi:MAG: hypothetical protein ACLVKO_02285 [Dysgonomonas sp.]